MLIRKKTMSMKQQAKDWLHQAESDLAFAQDGLASERYSHVCFMCQQAGETHHSKGLCRNQCIISDKL